MKNHSKSRWEKKIITNVHPINVSSVTNIDIINTNLLEASAGGQ